MVTYNTLIDVYGKMGRWEDAVQVLDDMTAKVSLSCLHQPDVAHVPQEFAAAHPVHTMQNNIALVLLVLSLSDITSQCWTTVIRPAGLYTHFILA